jgi:CHAT domain-containing protein
MKASLMVLVCLLFGGPALAQQGDTLRASQLTRQAEQLWDGNLDDSALVVFEEADRAWRAVLEKEESAKGWERYFFNQNRRMRTLIYLEKNEVADSIQQLYLPEVSDKLPQDHPELGYAHYCRAQVLEKQGKAEEAIPFYLSALPGLQLEGLIAKANQSLAYIYQKKGDYLSSNEHFLQALPLMEKREAHGLAACIYNIGWNYFRMGNNEKALAFYLKSLPVFKATRPDFYPQCLSSIGAMYRSIGEWEKGLSYLQQSLRFLSQNYPDDHPLLALTRVNMGSVYLGLQDYVEAEAYFLQALPILEAQDHLYLGTCLENLSIVYYYLHKDHQAIHYVQRALEWERARSPVQPLELASSLIRNGQFYAYRLSDTLQAEAYFQEALDTLRATPSGATPLITLLYEIGTVYRYFGKNEKALAFFQQSLMANLPDFENPNPLSHPPLSASCTIKEVYLEALHAKAKLLEKAGGQSLPYLLAVDTCYQLCVKVIDEIRNSYLEEDSKLRLQETYRSIYEANIQNSLLLYEQTQQEAYLHQAFSLSEKARAVVLSEALKTSRARSFAGLPDTVLEAEQRMRWRLNRTESSLFSLTNEDPAKVSSQLAELQAQLFSQQQAYDSLLLLMERSYPRYYQLKYQAEPVQPADLQDRLTSNQAFLSYVLADSSLFGFLISQEHFIPFSQKIDSSLQQHILGFQESLKSPTSRQDQAYRQQANSLYQFLLAPVAEWLEGKELIIATDGPLALIPFEVLIKRLPEPGKAKPEKTAFLLHEHAISYVFSASTWFQQYEQGHASNQQVLAFAPAFNPLESPVPFRRNRDLSEEQDTLRGGIAELRGARQELELIRNLLEVKAFKGLEANEAAFKSLAPQYGILHLATHAMIDPEDALSSYLLLSPTDDSLEDNRLHAWELYNMQLQAQMAVLSACNTGSGELVEGEGVMSLGRAFAYAGVPSVVMSLWPVEDASTTEVMGYFYEGLAEGMAKDEALRQAKLRFLDNAPPDARHPFYWAGFVVQGDAGPLRKPGLSWQMKLAALLALLVLSLIYWQIRKRKDD